MIYNSCFFFLVRKRLPTAFVYLYTQCLFLVVLLLLLLSVKLLSVEFAAVSELSDEKFNGPYVRIFTRACERSGKWRRAGRKSSKRERNDERALQNTMERKRSVERAEMTVIQNPLQAL